MMRLVTWSAPIAAFVACLGVAEILFLADLWLGGLLLVAAIAILILPALHPEAPEDDASTAHAPRADHLRQLPARSRPRRQHTGTLD